MVITRRPFTRVRIQMAIVEVMNVQKRGTTILTGTPPHGGILLFWPITKLNVTCSDVRATIELLGAFVKRHIVMAMQSIGQHIIMKQIVKTIIVSW